MEEGEAAPVGGIEAAAQVVPALDLVHRLVGDDLLQDRRRRLPVDAAQHQEAAVEPGLQQVHAGRRRRAASDGSACGSRSRSRRMATISAVAPGARLRRRKNSWRGLSTACCSAFSVACAGLGDDRPAPASRHLGSGPVAAARRGSGRRRGAPSASSVAIAMRGARARWRRPRLRRGPTSAPRPARRCPPRRPPPNSAARQQRAALLGDGVEQLLQEGNVAARPWTLARTDRCAVARVRHDSRTVHSSTPRAARSRPLPRRAADPGACWRQPAYRASGRTPWPNAETYEILAIKYGDASEPHRARELHASPTTTPRPIPIDYFVWVIRNANRTILVDTGFDQAEAEPRGRNDRARAARGAGADRHRRRQDRHLIVTHLHYDHAGTLDHFPAARFHIQDAEMAYATGRCMCEPSCARSVHRRPRLRDGEKRLFRPRHLPRRRRRGGAGHHRAPRAAATAAACSASA